MAPAAAPPPPPSSLASRSSSGTIRARLHSFVKSALLQQLVPPGSTVCDLYCGRGLDTDKWAKAQIGRYIGVDYAASNLEEAREQWNLYNRPYPAEFVEVDPCSEDLETELRHTGLPADFVTCMGHLQDCFADEDSVKILLLNVHSVLRSGGYFFGITADSSTIWSKYQKVVESAHRHGSSRAIHRVHSEHYTISFEDDKFTPFGTKYTLQFTDSGMAESQQLIHFPSLIRLAEEAGLEYIELQNLQEFYDDYRIQFYDILRTTCNNLVDSKGKLPQFVHDILSLYTTFIFKKADFCDYDLMFSPLMPVDEDFEICPEDDTVDGTVKRIPAESGIQNEVKEAYMWRSEEDAVIMSEVNGHQSKPGNGQEEMKPSSSKIDSSSKLGQDSNEGQISSKILYSTELGQGDDSHQSQMESMVMDMEMDMEMVVEVDMEVESADEAPIETSSRSPFCDRKTQTILLEDMRKPQVYTEIGDEPKRTHRSEAIKEEKEGNVEQQMSESNPTKMDHSLSCHPGGVANQNLNLTDHSLEHNDFHLTGAEGEEMKSDLHVKDGSTPKLNDNERALNPQKHSSGQAEVYGKVETFNKRPQTGALEQQHQATPPMGKQHLHSSYVDHKSHGPHNMKVPRADHRAEHLNPRADGHRNRPRGAPTFVPFVHFIPQTEFPVFQSPNTPGILGPGPGPPLRLPEPIAPFWPIHHPIERRVPPAKSRPSRKPANETSSSRARKESPKKNTKDSGPPPTKGTQ